MPLFNAVKHKPAFRFGGFQTMGASTRPVDTRSKEQLLENIEYFAKHNPEVERFKNELKSINPKHLGLVSDICELANRREMLNTNIDMKKLFANGKNLFETIIEKLPKASKENPEALNFAQEVINQTDSTASKYFLASAVGMFDHPEAAKHLAAAKPIVKQLAEQTLSGGYTMDYSKEKNFVDLIATLINRAAKPEKIALISKLSKAADKLPGENPIYLNSFVNSNAPLMQVEENLKQLPQMAKVLAKEGKPINIVDFVNHNVNFARAKQNIDIESLKNGNIKPDLEY